MHEYPYYTTTKLSCDFFIMCFDCKQTPFVVKLLIKLNMLKKNRIHALTNGASRTTFID